VGVEERILLTSRDEETCLIVSYKELKKCIEQSFRELL
jgi:PAB-dependent poly(A)-specific ribonuclease subunit 3